MTLGREAKSQLLAHTWPGNVRELQNTMERAVLLSPQPEITPAALLFDDQDLPAAVSFKLAPFAPEPAAAGSAPHNPPTPGSLFGPDQNIEQPVNQPLADPAAVMNGLQLPPTLREAEKMLIMQALGHTEGNRTHAAKVLGISVRTLRNKLNEYKHEHGFEVD